MSFTSKHYSELKASGISDEVIERYFYSIEGQAAQEWLIEDELGKLSGHSQQYATKPVQWLLKQSEHVIAGGWVCRANGQIKPDNPRQAVKKRSDGQWVPALNGDGSPKLVKYESIREKPYQGAHVEVMRPIGDITRNTYVINEGGKKTGCTVTLGYRGIPLPGVDMGAKSGTDELIPAINGLHRDADIVIAFDSDSEQSTIEGVARSTARLGRLLQKAGFTSIRVAGWEPSAGKGLDDVFVAKGAEFVHAAINNAQSFARWQSSRMARVLRSSQLGFYGLTGTRNIVNQRYVDLQLPAPGSILAISSAMETGKTVSIGRVKSEFFTRHPDGLFELQGYRNGLGQQTAGKWQMDHISYLEASAPGISQMLIDDAQSLAYCLDSLHRRARAIHDAIADGRKVCIVLDEADAVLKHVLGGGTLGKRQADIWELWCSTLAAVIAGGGYIIVAEANLSQIAVDAIAEISGGKVDAVENTYQPHAGRKVFDYSALSKKGKHADQLLAKACLTHVRRLAADDGPVFLATDSQGFAEKTDAALAADGYEVLRIDSDTIDRPEVRAFLENPDGYIAEHQPAVVIVTTTAESGVSISGGYFENVVLYGSHLEDRALGQLSGRVRGEAPLHLFVKRRVNSFNDDPDAFSIEGIQKEWGQNAFDSAAAVDISQYFDAAILKAAGKRTHEASSVQFHQLKATYQARTNISRFSLHYGVISILKAMACEITSEALQPSSFAKADQDAFDHAGEIVVMRRTVEFVAAELDQSVSWAMRVEGSASSSRADRTKAKKILLDASYPGLPFDNEEFVKDEIIKGRGDGLRAHSFAWLCNHPKIAKIIDLQSWKTQLEQQFIIMPALRKQSARVKILAQSALMNIAKLESYEETTPLIVFVAQWAKERAKTLGRLFRLQIKDSQTNIHIVGKLLRKIGFKPVSLKRPGTDGNRPRMYKAEPEPYQAEVWAALEQKWVGELSDESIVIEQPSAPTSTICSKENTLMQIVDVGSKSPVDRGGGPGELTPDDQLALANLMIRYRSHSHLATQLGQSALSKIPAAVLARFAAITA